MLDPKQSFHNLTQSWSKLSVNRGDVKRCHLHILCPDSYSTTKKPAGTEVRSVYIKFLFRDSQY